MAQRVSSASVKVAGETVASIGRGLCLLMGVAAGDSEDDAETAADKLATLRVFADEEGKMNLSLIDIGGEALLVSQFTLLGDARKGRRPSFSAAAPPEVAEPLVVVLGSALRDRGVPVREGVFGARMELELVNEGPVTLILELEQGRIR